MRGVTNSLALFPSPPQKFVESIPNAKEGKISTIPHFYSPVPESGGEGKNIQTRSTRPLAQPTQWYLYNLSFQLETRGQSW